MRGKRRTTTFKKLPISKPKKAAPITKMLRHSAENSAQSVLGSTATLLQL
jgi:hypothetical protein